MNESYARVNAPFHYAQSGVMCSECSYTKIMQVDYFSHIFSIINSDWLQHARSV